MAGTVRLQSGTAPATPPTGHIHIYSKTDKKLYYKDDTGTEFELSVGTSLTSTDDLPEGAVNLYFTNERAQDAVGSALTDTTTINFTYNDALNVITADVQAASLTNAEISAIAAIAYSKLNLSNSIVDGDISGTASISHSKMAALTANRAMVTDGSGKATTSAVTDTSLGYLSGVTSDIQTQLDGKQATGNYITALTGDVTAAGPGSAAATIAAGAVTNAKVASGIDAVKIADGSVSNTEYQYLNGVTSSIQTQLDSKVADPTTTDGDIIYRSGGSLQRLPIGSAGEFLKVTAGLPAWEEEDFIRLFGDGSDGNLTVSGALSLSQIPYYQTLTIDAGANLNANGYPIFCWQLDLTNAPANGIQRNGNNGTSSSGTGSGNGGAGLAAQVLGASASGSNGAGGQTNNGTASGAASGVSPSNGGSGGNSGASGAGGTGTGVSAGSGGAVALPIRMARYDTHFIRGATIIGGGGGGDGGNSGGGDGANFSRGGGGGGGGAGVVVIYAAEVITGGSTPAGVIAVNGGIGGNSANQTTGNVGGSSGAGGGGGGYIYLCYAKKTGAAVADLLTAHGGNGGNGGNANGTGIGGAGGQGGNGGRIQVYNIATNVGTEVIGTVGSSGTAAVGTTGGTGGLGGTCQVTL